MSSRLRRILVGREFADKQQEYADRAMELLHLAVKADYNDAARMVRDRTLDALHEREDYKKLPKEMDKANDARRSKYDKK